MRTRAQAEKYREALGDEARERQERLARERHVCCGMPKDAGHHEACGLAPPPEDTSAVEGQTSLL